MKPDIFNNGSCWLRADFHLHTRADKEFHYERDDDSRFVQEYIARLRDTDISIGVITNHNKFDRGEFRKLRKAAIKENIWLVAGIEFSLKEGIHLLIAFEDKWYKVKGHDDHINKFIENAFYGVSNYDISPYPNSRFSLKEVVEALDEIGLDYFLVLPHPDDKNGLFEVLKGRTLEQFVKDNSFDKIIALQKSGNKDNYDRLCELANRDIACVEGLDYAQGGIDAVGNGRMTYIKVGAFNFGALKYALTDGNNRIYPREKPKINNAYIESIAFKGGLLDKKVIAFSPELNNFIGIRGSGKSSILEILRYALGISLGDQASDRDYKNDLIEHVLRSGGKVITTVVDRHGKMYRIEKIYGQREDVYKGDTHIDIPSIDTVFKRPVYFGQKDLSNKHIGFEADLVKKLIGNRLGAVKAKITQESSEIKDVISKLKKIEDLGERKKETTARISDAEYKLKLFEEKGIAKKLEQQSNFGTDIARIENIREEVSDFQGDLAKLHSNYELFFY